MIGNLVDHRADAYRATGDTVGSHGQSTTTLAAEPVAAGFPCSVLVDSERLEQVGPGELAIGAYRVGSPDPGLDILEGDVVHVHTGPEAPLTLRVESRSSPRGAITLLRCATWKGKLPT